MKKALSALAISGAILTTSCANMGISSDPIAVTESTTINASAADVWVEVGGFNSLARWHPAVKISRQLHDQRYLTLANDAEIVEQETARNEDAMSYSYRILSGPLPVEDYHATISVMPVGSDKAKVTWRSTFEAAGVSDSEAEDAIRGVYKAGLQQLNRMFVQ